MWWLSLVRSRIREGNGKILTVAPGTRNAQLSQLHHRLQQVKAFTSARASNKLLEAMGRRKSRQQSCRLVSSYLHVAELSLVTPSSTPHNKSTNLQMAEIRVL